MNTEEARTNSGLRVLCVENEPMVRSTLVGQLEHLGHEPVAVETTTAGMEILSTTPIDLILLDFKLPDLSGIDAVRALRSVRSRVPIIVTTGIAAQARRDLADEAIDGFLDKPYDLDGLKRLMDSFVGR